MIAPLSKMPALPIAIGLIAGVLLWTAGASWWTAIGLFAAGTALFYKKAHYLAFGLYAAAAGWALSQMNEPPEAPDGLFDGEEKSYTAIIRDISTHPGGQTVILKIDSLEGPDGRMIACSPFNIRATELPDWGIFVGEKLRITTVIEPVDTYGDFPHDRDLRLYNLRQGVVGQAFLEDADVHQIGTDHSAAWWLARLRGGILHILARSGLSDSAYGLIAAITVGHGDDLEGSMRENFRAAGIAHVLALSGFHVGVIVMLVSVALFPLRAFYRLRRWRMAAALLIIWFYAAMVGMPPSVLRSVAMFSIILLSKIFRRDANPFNALCAAVSLIVTFSPFSIFSTGFQLSVGAVIGILALSDKLNPFNPKRHMAYALCMLVTVPFAAIAGTMVVTAASFHRLPVLFALTNFAISLLLPPLMLGGMAIIVAGAFGWNAAWLCKAVDFLTGAADYIAEFVAGLSFSEIGSIYLTATQTAALASALISIAVAVNWNRRRVLIACGIVFTLSLPVFFFANERIPEKEAFIINQSGNTPIVVREGSRLSAVFTCHPRRIENAQMRFIDRIRDYAESRGVDTINIIKGDFEGKNFSREGNIVTINGCRIGLAASPGNLDSVDVPVRYALVGSRFRGSAGEIEKKFRPDTIVLSRDLSLKRAAGLRRDATRPVIDLRSSRLNLD